MRKGMTQRQMVLEYIKMFGSIDPQEAYFNIGCMKLATRVSELKREGHNIVSETITATNRWGKTVHFKRYRLGEQQ